jgi:hypothetical protein
MPPSVPAADAGRQAVGVEDNPGGGRAAREYAMASVMRWLEVVELQPSADFSVRAFLAMHLREEMAAHLANEEPATGVPVADGAAEPTDMQGAPLVTGVNPSQGLQERYEDEAVMKLGALQRVAAKVASSDPSLGQKCEHLKLQVIRELLVQLSTVAQCAAEFGVHSV